MRNYFYYLFFDLFIYLRIYFFIPQAKVQALPLELRMMLADSEIQENGNGNGNSSSSVNGSAPSETVWYHR